MRDFTDIAGARIAFKQLSDRLDHLESLDIDLHGRKIINAGDAKDSKDYITLQQLSSAISGIDVGSDNTDIPKPIVPETKEYAFAYNSAAQVIPSGATTILTYNTNISDSSGIHPPGSRFTAKVAGLYLCLAHVLMPIGTSGTNFTFQMVINGSGGIPYSSYWVTKPDPVVYPSLFLSYPVVLAIGGFVEFAVTHNAVGSVNTMASYCNAGIFKIS